MQYCHGKHLILALTGGIAAYKGAELVRRGREVGLNIDVVMTAAAQKFVQPITFQALSGRRVLTDLWDPLIPDSMAHIHLSRDRKSTRLNSSHVAISYAVFCLK